MTETAAAEVTPSASSSSGGLTLAVLAAAGVVLALAAAWVVPWLAIPVVWPLLFLVPGWGLLAFVRPRIAATGRLGLAIVLSVALSAHLVYWLSLATGGYRRETIFAVAVLLALPIPLAASRGGLPALGAPIGAAWRSLRREPIGFALALLAAGWPTEAGCSLLAWGSALLSEGTKRLVDRPRPAPPLVAVTPAPIEGTSFPSGHVLTYVGFYGFLAYLVALRVDQPALRDLGTGALVGLLALVGPSRIQQGHHWPTDVAASYLLGAAYLLALIELHARLSEPSA